METKICVRLQIATVAMLLVQVLWDVKLCHWVSGSIHFKGQGAKEEYLHPSNLEDECTVFLSKCQETLNQQHSVMYHTTLKMNALCSYQNVRKH